MKKSGMRREFSAHGCVHDVVALRLERWPLTRPTGGPREGGRKREETGYGFAQRMEGRRDEGSGVADGCLGSTLKI